MQIVAARSEEHWGCAAELLRAYHREVAVDPDEVPDPSAAYDTYFIAYEGTEPVGGTAVVAQDDASLRIERCYVVPEWRRRGVARQFVAAVLRLAERSDALRVVIEVPTSGGAVEAWRHLGFVDAGPSADATRISLERHLDDGPG